MKRLIIFFLFIPLSAIAEPLPDDVGEYIRAVQSLVKTERVIVEREGVGLLVPAREMFSGSGELMDSGRLVLEKAGYFSRQAKKKLIVIVPDEREHKDFRPVSYLMYGGIIKRNALIGPYVYVLAIRP
ncbi:MAG TPA: hypothetical protein VMV75_04295 [Sulfuricella sp.]|nr:hypothetical protein [Sulfuricella sp.]